MPFYELFSDLDEKLISEAKKIKWYHKIGLLEKLEEIGCQNRWFWRPKLRLCGLC